jgi:hypothetical protein
MELGGDAAAERDMLILLDLTSDFPMTVAPFRTMVNVAFIAFADACAQPHGDEGAHCGNSPP